MNVVSALSGPLSGELVLGCSLSGLPHSGLKAPLFPFVVRFGMSDVSVGPIGAESCDAGKGPLGQFRVCRCRGEPFKLVKFVGTCGRRHFWHSNLAKAL